MVASQKSDSSGRGGGPRHNTVAQAMGTEATRQRSFRQVPRPHAGHPRQGELDQGNQKSILFNYIFIFERIKASSFLFSRSLKLTGIINILYVIDIKRILFFLISFRSNRHWIEKRRTSRSAESSRSWRARTINPRTVRTRNVSVSKHGEFIESCTFCACSDPYILSIVVFYVINLFFSFLFSSYFSVTIYIYYYY